MIFFPDSKLLRLLQMPEDHDFLSLMFSWFPDSKLLRQLQMQGARNLQSPVLANEDQVLWGCKRTCKK